LNIEGNNNVGTNIAVTTPAVNVNANNRSGGETIISND